MAHDTLQSQYNFLKKEKALIISALNLSGQKDSNLRPPAPKAGALAGLRHTPKSI